MERKVSVTISAYLWGRYLPRQLVAGALFLRKVRGINSTEKGLTSDY
jgi:hypothetical protein